MSYAKHKFHQKFPDIPMKLFRPNYIKKVTHPYIIKKLLNKMVMQFFNIIK